MYNRLAGNKPRIFYSYSLGDMQEDNSGTVCHFSVPCAFRILRFNSATFSAIPDTQLHCTTV
jgi:hypothetical protein